VKIVLLDPLLEEIVLLHQQKYNFSSDIVFWCVLSANFEVVHESPEHPLVKLKRRHKKAIFRQKKSKKE